MRTFFSRWSTRPSTSSTISKDQIQTIRCGSAATSRASSTTGRPCSSMRSRSRIVPSISSGVSVRARRRPGRSPPFLSEKRNRYLLDFTSKRYNKSPSDYLLSDDPLAALRYQIDEVCAETGTEVDALMEITVEKNKKRDQRFNLEEVLDNNFVLPDDLQSRSGQ